MEIEVVTREIREQSGLKLNPGHAVEAQRVGRHLHDDVGAARVRHAAQKLLQLVGFRRRPGGGQLLIADVVCDRADKSDLRADALLQYMLDERRRRRLAVRPRHAHHREHTGRPVEIRRRYERERKPAVRRDDIRPIDLRRLLAEHGSGAPVQRRPDIPVAVRLQAANGDEQVARLHRPRVIAHVPDGKSGISRHGRDLDILYEFPQRFHSTRLPLIVRVFRRLYVYAAIALVLRRLHASSAINSVRGCSSRTPIR